MRTGRPGYIDPVLSCGKNEENVIFKISSNTNHVAVSENKPYIAMRITRIE